MSFTEELKSELSNILQYWITNTIDHENGGFVGEIALDNSVVKNAGKGAVLNARILWTFSSAYRLFPKKEYLEMAERAYDYLVNYFWDKENGGLYWEVITREFQLTLANKSMHKALVCMDFLNFIEQQAIQNRWNTPKSYLN